MMHWTIDHTITSQDVITMHFFHQSLDFPKANFGSPSRGELHPSFVNHCPLLYFDLCAIRNLLRIWISSPSQVPIGD